MRHPIPFPQKVTFDSSRTPKRGEKVKRTAALKPLDLGSLKERLSTIEAEKKANDPRELKAEIARLNAELRKKAAAPDTSTADEARKVGYAAGQELLR